MSANYAEFTTRLYKAQSDLGWALRDKKPTVALRCLREIEYCTAQLRVHIETSNPKRGLWDRLNAYLGGNT